MRIPSRDTTPTAGRRIIAAVDVLVIVALLSLPLGAAAVVVAVALVAVHPRPWTAVLGAALAVALTAVWLLLSYRDGVRADETGAQGDVFSQVGWLVAAVLCGAAALWRQRRGPAVPSWGARHLRPPR